MRKWTDEQIGRLKILWEHGKNDEEIGKIIGMTATQVQHKRHLLHISRCNHYVVGVSPDDPIINDGPHREFSRTSDMLIVQFLSEGYSLTQVAMELARDYKTILL